MQWQDSAQESSPLQLSFLAFVLLHQLVSTVLYKSYHYKLKDLILAVFVAGEERGEEVLVNILTAF